ncbi:hypothetical protein [Streptomyces sp. TR06-5]|uniref:hypothetical protein n=1 Tax=unclassified Streptomyces TaxID=2593676 RepID=UPI0039A20ACC
MTPDEQTAQRRPAGGPSTLRRVGFWTALFAAFYGLTLFVLTDGWFLLAMPGIIGLATVGAILAWAVLNTGQPKTVPFATDGSDPQGPLTFHRAALLKRYLLLLALVALLVGLVVTVRSDYLIPLAPLAVLLFIVGTQTMTAALVTASRCSRVLKVYPFTYREPVKILHRARGGKQLFRLGSGEQESPKLVGTQLGGEKDWGKRIGDGAHFAGDDLYGGVLLVPDSGELVWVKPVDGPALAPHRTSVSPERRDRAAQAGLSQT